MTTPATDPVFVVGAGLAGTVAACRLAARGLSVRLVTDRPGASALHGGGWQLGRAALVRFWPGAATHLDAALTFVRSGLAPLALHDGPFVLADIEGARRACDLAPASHAVVAGFGPQVALADLSPLAHPFAAMQSAGTPVTVAWPPRADDLFGRSFAYVGQQIEAEPSLVDALVAALRAGLAGRAFDGVLLPPVLGGLGAEARRQRLCTELGLPVGEALDALPSAPGLRLHAALGAWRAAAGVETETVRVEALTVDPLGLRVDGAFRPASAIVLATGRYLTGGLTMHPAVTEALGSLPLAVSVATNPLTDARHAGPYDAGAFATGVRVDAAFRICGPDGRPVHRGLFAAGDVVGGHDALTAGCASGLAVGGAYAAAEALTDGEVR